jgi:hypothetical protein
MAFDLDIRGSHKVVWILSTTLPFSFAIICGFILWKYYMQTLVLRTTKKGMFSIHLFMNTKCWFLIKAYDNN